MAMKFAAAATIFAAASAAAFTVQKTDNGRSINNVISENFNAMTLPSSKLFSSTSGGAPCDIPDDVVPTDLTAQKGSASLLRSAVLTNVDGDFVSLDRLMGKEKSVVIFLRHMG
mmetsp:Transcript_13483/g.17037  ORF Transcript_13483/g.17037 Transcript_13483/m.17037 type:complete len:114 (+) Transcript_13483:22-363(+)